MIVVKTLETDRAFQLVDITGEINRAVKESGIGEGICVVYTGEADAGILLTSRCDPKSHEDILDDFETIVPARGNFLYDGPPAQGAARVKSAVAGTSRDLIVENGVLALGDSQGVFFAEYNGGKKREYRLKILGQ